jgi:hypothetical protein
MNPAFDMSNREIFYPLRNVTTIYGYINSTAQEFAEKEDLKFISLGKAPVTDNSYEDITYEFADGPTLIISGTGAVEKRMFNKIFSNYPEMKSAIKSVIIKDGITSIDDEAFFCWKELESVTLPDTLTSIGEYAFEGCEALKSIDFPNSVTSIGKYAFGGCTELRSVVIPDSVTYLRGDSFRGCYLASLTLPQSLKDVDGTFEIYGLYSCCSITILNRYFKMASLSIIDYNKDYIVISGYKGSTAQEYAEANGYKFVALDENAESYSSGDANCDGGVDLADAVTIMQALANPNKYGLNGSEKTHITAQGIKNADVVGNNGMTTEDAGTIQRYLLHIIDELPVEK